MKLFDIIMKYDPNATIHEFDIASLYGSTIFRWIGAMEDPAAMKQWGY